MIAHNQTSIGTKDIVNVSKVLKSGNIATGAKVQEFEKKLRKYIGSRYAIAVNSGTDALYLALKALGVKSKDEVILPTYVCSAVLNPIYYLDAKPVLVDVSKNSFNIDYDEVKKKLSKKTRCIIIPHTYGSPVDLKPFIRLNIPILEDCAQSIGAEVDNKKAGSIGKIAIFSFYATKLLTTGQGGMILTDDKEIAENLKDITEYDLRKRYRVRYNFKLSDIQAALGISQLEQLNAFLKRRKNIAKRYDLIIKESENIRKQDSAKNAKRVYYRYVLRVKQQKKWIIEFSKRNIKIINPLERYELLHRYLKLNPKNFPNSEHIVRQTISLPIYPSLTEKEIIKIEDCLRYCVKKFG